MLSWLDGVAHSERCSMHVLVEDMLLHMGLKKEICAGLG